MVDDQNVPKNRISELAAREGIKIPALAKMIGMKAPTLRVYTRQERQPKAILAAKIAEALGCKINEVLGLDEYTFDQMRHHSPEPPDPVIHQENKEVETPTGKIPLFAEANLNDPISFIDPPHWVVSDSQSYASFVPDGTGSTRFKPGDMVIVEPYLPIRNGDPVMVVAKKFNEAKKLDVARLMYIATMTEGDSYCDNTTPSDHIDLNLALDFDAVRREHHRITGVHFQ